MSAAHRQISVIPKIISWFGMPSHIGEQEKFELLKRDIFLHDARFEQLPGLWAINSRFTAYAFNLDRILEFLPFPRLSGVMVLARRLIQFISGFCPHNALVHTRILNKDIRYLFEESGISLYQENLEYKPKALSLLHNHLLPILTIENRPVRKFIRVGFEKTHDYRVTLKLDTDGYEEQISGILKDLSLNGAGITLNDHRALRRLPLRTPVKAAIRHAQTHFQIATAFVTRRDENSREVGINFNIQDESFIARHDAIVLSRIIYGSLQEFTSGKIKTNLREEFDLRAALGKQGKLT